MENQFFIKNGSFCFIIPFFTENSFVCNTFFNELKSKLDTLETQELDKNKKKQERKDIIKKLKAKFINDIKTDYFSEIKPNFHTRFCKGIKHNEKEYNGRFVCKCMSSAVKFHDDISQKKNTAHFFLDSFEVNYQHKNFKCSFKFNTILYLTHEDNEKAAYLLFEINMVDINEFKSTLHYINSEQIIFIKHLFYKSKMKLQIQRLSNNKEIKNNCSLQEWVNEYINQLILALKLNYNKDVPEYISKYAFKYSFIELKDICDKNGKDLDIDFNHIDINFLDKYSQQAYGLLLSDEGWYKTPIQITKRKLQDYWTTRDFLCTFFLQHNALLFNLKNTEKGKIYTKFEEEWFSKYQENKYKDYVSHNPCLTGVDSLAIFPFLKAIYKEINIDRFEQNYKNTDKFEDTEFIRKSVSDKIKEARKELDLLQEILDKTSLNLGEIASMEKCIYKQFGIIEKMEQIKERYQQQVDQLNFIYEDANNQNILNLTILTFILGILSLILSFFN